MQLGDTLQASKQAASTLPEPILATSGHWLAGFVQAYVWSDPGGLLFMLVAYFIAFLADLYLAYAAQHLSPALAGKKIVKTVGNMLGALVLLFLATNTARYNTWLYWLPTAFYAALISALILQITKTLSKLGYISPQIAEFIEKKVSITQLENEKGNDRPPIGGPEGDLADTPEQIQH